MLGRARQRSDDANLTLNLSFLMQCLGLREQGLAIQSLALQQQRIYRREATLPPAGVRLLVLQAAGEMAINAPLDCLLDESDVELIYCYLSPNEPLPIVPEHDAAYVAICDLEETRTALASLAETLAHWPRPVINRPQNIRLTGRAAASKLLSNIPGLLAPPTFHVERNLLRNLAGMDFPVIIRPLDSHAGRDLAKVENLQELDIYLAHVKEPQFYISPFIDYCGNDGLFRKIRVALIDGKPYVCHVGISSHWMIHYLNAGMYEDSKKREEEAAFMDRFDDFARRHHAAIDAIVERAGLEYLCIDCAEMQDGRLLVFEIDPAMVVHAMDPVDLFPYKQAPMQKVKAAFRNLLFRLTKR
jgi:glutathione synthase/RimK-type ligase-like ATP-grasp enzyme